MSRFFNSLYINSYMKEASGRVLFFLIVLIAFRIRLSKHSSVIFWLIFSMVKQFVPNQTLSLNKSLLVLIIYCYDYTSINTLISWCFKNYSNALLSFSSILMSGVNWDSTKKVMECQSCDTVTLMMISYKIVCRSRTTMSIVPKKKIAKIF